MNETSSDDEQKPLASNQLLEIPRFYQKNIKIVEIIGEGIILLYRVIVDDCTKL